MSAAIAATVNADPIDISAIVSRETVVSALAKVRDGVITGEGPTTRGRVHFSRALDTQDVDWCVRILTASAVERLRSDGSRPPTGTSRAAISRASARLNCWLTLPSAPRQLPMSRLILAGEILFIAGPLLAKWTLSEAED